MASRRVERGGGSAIDSATGVLTAGRVSAVQDIVVFGLFQIVGGPKIVIVVLSPADGVEPLEHLAKAVMPTTISESAACPHTASTPIATARSSSRAAARFRRERSRRPAGINFVLLCRHGTAVWLILSEPCDGEIHAEIPLDPLQNRTGDHWHVRVDGLPEEFCYGYRVDGPKDNGHRYDTRIILHDPYSRALSCGRPWGLVGQPARAAA